MAIVLGSEYTERHTESFVQVYTDLKIAKQELTALHIEQLVRQDLRIIWVSGVEDWNPTKKCPVVHIIIGVQNIVKVVHCEHQGRGEVSQCVGFAILCVIHRGVLIGDEGFLISFVYTRCEASQFFRDPLSSFKEASFLVLRVKYQKFHLLAQKLNRTELSKMFSVL